MFLGNDESHKFVIKIVEVICIKADALKVLCCPICKGNLEVTVQFGDKDIIKGILLCKSCMRRFPIEAGIPKLDRISELQLRFCPSCEKEVEIIKQVWRKFPNRLIGETIRCFQCNQIIEQEHLDKLSPNQQNMLQKIAIAEDFDRTAPIYEKFRFQFASLMMGVNPFAAIDKLINIPVSRVDARGGNVIVDVATGTGLGARELSKKIGPNGEVYGLDISMGQLLMAKATAHKNKLKNITFVKGDAEELPFKNGSFERATCLNAIGLFDFSCLLKEIARVLQNGSKIVVSLGVEPPKHNFPMKIPFALFKRYGVTFLSLSEIIKIIKNLNFIDGHLQWIGLMMIIDTIKPK